MGKRYYWLKLKSDFFDSKRIKKLRRLAGGDTYVIIYLKLQLKAMQSDGVLTWTGLEDDFASELALDIDEEPDNVRVTLQYLLNTGLAESSDNVNFFLPFAVENTASETAAAQRMREMRARNNVTPLLRDRYGEKEKDTETEKETEKERRFRPPTVDEVVAYCTERNNNVDPQRFVDYYTSKGWMLGKNKMKDWRAAVRTWERRNNDSGRNSSSPQGSATAVSREWEVVYD